MSEPLVSVVIPVYNGREYVAEAIESVWNQSHRCTEIIAVDDGSTDDSLSLLRGLGERLTVVSQSNAGVAGARNRGMEAATGDYIAFLDQDDWWQPEKLARQLDVFRNDDGVGLVHTRAAFFHADSNQPAESYDPTMRPEDMVGDCYESLLQCNPLVNSSVMLRRKVLEDVGRCDAELAGNTVADYELWLRVAKRYRFGFVDEPLTCYRMHEQQGMLDRRAMLEAELRVLLKQRGDEFWYRDPQGRSRLAKLYDDLAVAWYDASEFPKARGYFLRAWRLAKSKKSFLRLAGSLMPPRFVSLLRNTT